MYRIIGVDGKEYGPVSFDELRRWIAEGRANGQTPIREEGGGEWRPLREFPAFGPELESGPRRHAPVFSSSAGLATERTGGASGLATAGLVCGIFGLCCCPCGPLFPLAGLILSVMALTRSNGDPAAPGRGLAVAGIVISLLSLLGSIGLWSAQLLHLGRPFRFFQF